MFCDDCEICDDAKKVTRFLHGGFFKLQKADVPIYCVAGKIAAGKNYVASIFEQNGFFCIDAFLSF